MKEMKHVSDCLKHYVPPLTNYKSTILGERALRNRIKKLEVGRKEAEKLIEQFRKAERREWSRIRATRQARKTMGQTSSEGASSGMSVSSVHGGERAPEGETGQEIPINEAVAQEGQEGQEGQEEQAGRGTNPGSRKLVKSFYCNPLRSVFNKESFNTYARPYCGSCSWRPKCPGWNDFF